MNRKFLNIFFTLICLGSTAGPVFAAKNFNVLNGSNSYLFVNGTSGNVGISSTNPGQLLDVQGTVRATGFALTTGASSGYVLTSNSVGVGTWAPAGGGGLWNTTNTNDVYEENGSTFGNVGIGTSITNAGAALSVMNGNVGIGTWVPGSLLAINSLASATPLTINSDYTAATFTASQSDANLATFAGPTDPSITIYNNNAAVGQGPILYFETLV